MSLFFIAMLFTFCQKQHLKWDHNVDGVSNFLDEGLAEVSGEPNFRPFFERKKVEKET